MRVCATAYDLSIPNLCFDPSPKETRIYTDPSPGGLDYILMSLDTLLVRAGY